MELFLLVILLIGATVAVITDLKTGMIFNWLTLPLFFIGLVFAFIFNGWTGVGSAVLAGLLTFVTTFKFTQFGGGDFKLSLAIGTCLGFENWLTYFVGMALTRIFFSLLIKIKTYTLSGLFNGLKCEITTNQIIPIQNNFKIFQEAARKAGYTGIAPTIPGAIWVAGGVYAVALSKIYQLL
jgi:hypothetical protein